MHRSLALIALLVAAAPALAQERRVSEAGGATPDVTVTGRAGCARRGAVDLACLDADLKQKARAPATAHANVDPAVEQGSAPSSRTNTFSYAATAQRLRSNFGHAAVPPPRPAPVYAHPIGGNH